MNLFSASSVQGKKEVLLGEETYSYGAAQYLVVSVDLPLVKFVVEATPDKPYLGFKLNLDPVQLCDIIAQIRPSTGKKETSVRGLFVSNAGASLIDCAIRLTRLLDAPQDIPFLAPMIIREIYYNRSPCKPKHSIQHRRVLHHCPNCGRNDGTLL